MITKDILDQTDIVAYVDRDGVYRYVNRMWQEKTGIGYDDAVGRNHAELIRGSGALSAIKTGRKVSGMMYYTVSSGKTFTASVKYRPVRDQQGMICGCTVESLFDDVGEAASFANELKKHTLKEQKLQEGRRAGSAKYSVDDIIGVSDATERMKEQIYIAAATNATVLIEGETGTGKELVAHAIHDLSSRSSFPFVRVNCSAIPENLMESEFFGYEEGSFTGSAKGGRTGKFEAADHGSLFLDEINAMQITMQPKLLRALQEKEIERIGGTVSIPVDDRIIAAANVPLATLVAKGEFRKDLYYRLNIIHIIIPPLRERSDDISVLADFFLKRYNLELNRNISGISDEASEYLRKKEWPGNIRELQNNIERAMIACRGEQLELRDFMTFGEPPAYRKSTTVSSGGASTTITEDSDGRQRDQITGAAEDLDHPPQDSLSKAKEETERKAILRALEICGGNKSKAAEKLEISRTLLYRKMKKYGIQ